MKGDKSLYKPSDIPPNPSLLTTIKLTVQRQSNTSFNSSSASTSTTTMHFINAIFALVAASAVMAAPAPAPAPAFTGVAPIPPTTFNEPTSQKIYIPNALVGGM